MAIWRKCIKCGKGYIYIPGHLWRGYSKNAPWCPKCYELILAGEDFLPPMEPTKPDNPILKL